jgi:CheY-like chemotaxis protein
MAPAVSPSSMRILVVEDSAVQRELACAVLRSAGFTVLSAANGEEALFTIAADPSIGVLVTDIVMPGGLDGWTLARKAVALRAGLRVLYTTAFRAAIPSGEDGPGYGPLLPKPWTSQQLLDRVRRVAGMTPGPRNRR